MQNRVAATFLPLLVVTSLAGAFSAGCSVPHEKVADTGPVVDVSVATASETEWPAHFDAGGILQSHTTATIASRLLAPVLAVHVRPGDRVRHGQVLVELDAATLVAAASRASAAETAASESVTAAAADVSTAQAGLTLANATHARIAELAATRAATAQELDEAVAGRAIAASRLAAAEARLKEATAARAAAAAGTHAAAVDASYVSLTAPFDGVVADRSIDPGSMASPGVPLLVIESPASLQLLAHLDAARAGAVTVGQAVSVRVDTDPADAPDAVGRVVEISRIDGGAHSFGVKIDVAAVAGWRSGLFGRARFAGAPRRALAIPMASILRRGQLAFVFVPADGRAHLRAVSIGEPAGANVEVLDGLAAGESVLLSPPPALADGARINIVRGAR